MFFECTHALTAHYGLTASLFLAGLVGSVTHCAGMCAPFVLAQTQSGLIFKKLTTNLLLPYHFGRMTTYVMLGILVHSMVNLAYLFSDTHALITAPLLMLAGIVFLVTAFPKLGLLFPWATRIKLPGFFTFIAHKGYQLIQAQGSDSRYLLGLTLGLIPCGLVIAALMAAATAPTALQAALAMFAFSLGTMPSLMAIGLFGQGLKQKFPVFSQRISRFALVASSLWLFFLAGNLII